jgi:hypothetical protein
MKNTLETTKEKLLADVDDAISQLRKTQFVHFKARGKEYIYASIEGKEQWAAPFVEQDDLKKLLSGIRQFEEQIKGINIDELVAKKFLARYYRMQSDMLVAADSMLVGYHCNTAEDGTVRERIDRATDKVHSLDKLLSKASCRNRKKVKKRSG